MSQADSAPDSAPEHVVPTEVDGETVEEAHDLGNLILQEVFDSRPKLEDGADDVAIASHLSDYSFFIMKKFSDEVIKEWQKNLLEGELKDVPADTIAQKLSFYETLTTELLYEMQHFVEDDEHSLINSIQKILRIKKKKLEETVKKAADDAARAAETLSASKEETRQAQAALATATAKITTLETAKTENERIIGDLRAEIVKLNEKITDLTSQLNAANTNLSSIRGTNKAATVSRVVPGQQRTKRQFEGGGLRKTHRKRTKIIL